MLLRVTIVLLFAVLVCYKQVNCMCSWPCNWQERTFYNEAEDVDLLVTNSYQVKIAPDTVIECLIREGPFIVNRRGVNKDEYRCFKINDVCEDSFVLISTPLIRQDFPPNLCDICTPGNLTGKPSVWVAKENTYLGCGVPKNCPVQRRTDIQCNGCEENQPNDDIACSTCKKKGRKRWGYQRKYSGEKKKSTYGSYSGDKKKSTYGSYSGEKKKSTYGSYSGEKKKSTYGSYSGEKKKSTYGSYSGEKKKSTYGSHSRSSYRG